MITNYLEVGPKVETVEGLVSAFEASYLFNIVNVSPLNGTIVEIGSHCGKSSIAMGFACLGTERRLYCIDPWLNEFFFDKWKENVNKFELGGCVTPLKGFSGDIFKTWTKLIDILFIDGNHGLTDVTKDFVIAYPWVKEQGKIAFHDCGHPQYPGVGQLWDVVKSILGNNVQMGSIVSGTKIFIR